MKQNKSGGQVFFSVLASYLASILNLYFPFPHIQLVVHSKGFETMMEIVIPSSF